MSTHPLQAWCQAFDWMSEAVWVVAPSSLTVVYANRAAQQLVGLSREQLLGSHVRDLAAAPQDVYRWNDLADVAQGQRTHTQVLHASGRVIPVEQCIRQIQDAHGADWLIWTLLDRSEQDATERELESLLAELRATLDSAADGMLVCGADGQIRAFNHKLAEIWTMPNALLLERNDGAVLAFLRSQVLKPQDYDRLLEQLGQQPLLHACDALQLRDGRVVERRSVPLLRHGVPAGRIFSFRDITQATEIQNGLRVAAQVFESSLDAIFIADANGAIVKTNPACTLLLGAGLPEGTRATELFDYCEQGWQEEVIRAWGHVGYWEGNRTLQRSNGSLCAVRLSWIASRDEQGKLQQSVGFMRDLTQQQAAQQQIEQLAFSDALTGLPNRLFLGQHVERAIAEAPESSFAILFLDLDRFKIINDSLGHQFGDRVLQLVAQRLQSCLRPHDVLCRLGGDEFVLYLHHCQMPNSERVAKRIQDVMREPFGLDGLGFSVQCSIGMAQYPDHGRSLDELIKQADTAMYRVKANGKGNYGFYEPAMSTGLLGRMQMEHALRQALSHEALRVVYQPQVEMASGRIVACEALLRWTDPQLGVVSPAVFIPLAEESGFIVKMGSWVLEQSIREAARWLKQGVAIKMSVNVSSLELLQPDFAARVAGLLGTYSLPACWLELELTESMLLQKEPVIVQCIEQLAALGVQLVIDDFGTGYSNLAYLKRMPISKLKVDQSFVRGLPQDASDKAIVEAVVSLGRALDVEIVAEGVETQAQRETLQSMGCGFYQGFLCAPGVESATVLAMLRAQTAGMDVGTMQPGVAVAAPAQVQKLGRKVSAKTTTPSS
ncbi:MAG: EAL domain-containing protein [Acidovorax sp.]|nr:EAL domain-containing protein [Acidovorax sp.]